jgi:hypothetical protein
MTPERQNGGARGAAVARERLCKFVSATAATSRKNRRAVGSDVFHVLRRQADSDATMEHVTLRPHINTVTAKKKAFSVASVPRLYDEDQLPLPVQLWVSCWIVRSRQLVSSEVGVRWSPSCKDVSPEGGERPRGKPLPSNVTENTRLCVIVICEV